VVTTVGLLCSRCGGRVVDDARSDAIGDDPRSVVIAARRL